MSVSAKKGHEKGHEKVKKYKSKKVKLKKKIKKKIKIRKEKGKKPCTHHSTIRCKSFPFVFFCKQKENKSVLLL